MKTLTKIFLMSLVLFLAQSCIVSQKPNMTFFKESEHDFKGAKFVSINVPLFLAKPYIKRALKKDGTDEEVIDLVRKVSKIRLLTVENGNREMLKDYVQYLNKNDYEDWATIKSDGNNVNIRVKQDKDMIRNMLITVNSDQEMVFVDVKGKFTPDDISKMISSATDK